MTPVPEALTRPQLLAFLSRQKRPVLVIFAYDAAVSLHEEWVYNSADLASQRVILAHDLGPQKLPLLIADFPGRTCGTCMSARREPPCGSRAADDPIDVRRPRRCLRGRLDGCGELGREAKGGCLQAVGVWGKRQKNRPEGVPSRCSGHAEPAVGKNHALRRVTSMLVALKVGLDRIQRIRRMPPTPN